MVVVAASLAAVATPGLAAPSSMNARSPSGQEDVAQEDTTGIDAATEVEIRRRFNELRSEILDDRADAIGWWLSGIAFFLSFLVLLIAVAGYLGFRKLREIEEEARRNVELTRAHAEEAFKFVEEIRGYGGETDERLRSINQCKCRIRTHTDWRGFYKRSRQSRGIRHCRCPPVGRGRKA